MASRGNSRVNRERKAKRLVEIETLLGAGVSELSIQLRAKKQWDVSDRLIRKDILAIQEKWASQAEQENKPGFRRSQCRQMLHAIYQKAMSNNAFGPAVSAVGRLMELDGLRQLKFEAKTESTRTTKVQIMTSDEKRKKVEAYVAKMGAAKKAAGRERRAAN